LQCLRVDALADPSEIDGAFLQANRLIQPCGCGNPEPVYAATDVRIVGAPRVLKDRHLKLLVGAGGRNLEAIWFNMAGSGVPAGEVDMAFAVDENWFMGESFLQLRVEDIRPADGASVGELSR
jgi:single-stranded-DNA-specific exonuclease